MSPRAAAFVVCIATFAAGVSSAGGQASPTGVVHTYDVVMVGTATARSDDHVLVEKATLRFQKVRVRVIDSSRFVIMTVDGRGKPADARGSMSGQATYTETDSTPCTVSVRPRGAARLDVSGQGGRSLSISGEWAGPGRAVYFDRKQCPAVADRAPIGYPWEHERGGVLAQFDRTGGIVSWMIRAVRGRRLPFPLDRLRSGKSFSGAVSGTTDDGYQVREGTIRVTLTARR